MKNRILCYSPSLFLLSMLMALSSASFAVDSNWAFGVHFENDLFADTDSNYTNGVKITAVSPDLESAFRDRDDLPDWLRNALPLQSLPFSNDEQVTRTFAFSVGQNMYSPQDTSINDLIVTDRPYAGWLYLGATFMTRTEDQQDTFDAQFGIIGPYSFAEQAQELVHRARNFKLSKGWNHQLRTEPGLVLAYERSWRLRVLGRMRAGFASDVITNAGGALGNVAIYAKTGAQLRVGWNLPLDFGYSVIRPGGVTQISSLPKANNRGFADRHALFRAPSWSVYFFSGVEGRLVGRDIFLQGNSFRHSHNVDHKPFVGDLMAGFTASYKGLKFSIAKVMRTREFRAQRSDHRFGSITLSYAF